jgi:DNA polymerase gamma 1
MLLSIRAGRSSRPCASFVRLARHRAHRRQDDVPKILGGQWRFYATEVVRSEESAASSASLLSKCSIISCPDCWY